MHRKLLVAAATMLLVTGCSGATSSGVVEPSSTAVATAAPTVTAGPSPSATLSPTSTPSPSPTAVPSLPTPLPSATSPVTASITACHVDLAVDVGNWTPPPPPSQLPSYLPADLVPEGATVYALSLPPDYIGPIYTVGPAGGTCEAGGGNYIDIGITDPAGNPSSDVFIPGSAGPNATLSCAYIPAAMAAFREYADAAAVPDAPTLDPAKECSVQPGEQVVPIATGVKDFYLAAVLSPPAASESAAGDRTVALFTFRKDPGSSAEGQATVAGCTLSAAQQAICVADLAFFLAQVVEGTLSHVGRYGMTEARRAGIYKELTDLIAR